MSRSEARMVVAAARAFAQRTRSLGGSLEARAVPSHDARGVCEQQGGKRAALFSSCPNTTPFEFN
eukprot:scaffold13739_cov58-Phaeocystis_antarctica.AAC.7